MILVIELLFLLPVLCSVFLPSFRFRRCKTITSDQKNKKKSFNKMSKAEPGPGWPNGEIAEKTHISPEYDNQCPGK
jgi:hypothetical protein